MLEIIRDIAPGAELWFANFETTLEFANAATFVAANVDVMVSDVVAPGFFPNGQNSVTLGALPIINNPSNRARTYIQSVGNQADSHYSAVYTDSGQGDEFGHYHLFRSNSETTGPNAPSPFDAVTVAPSTSIAVWLSWDDPAGASINDYDLLLFDCATGELLDFSAEEQSGHQEPEEVVFYANSTADLKDVCYAIQNFSNAAAPRMLNVAIDGDDFTHEFNTASKSLIPPADAPGDMIAVGAVPAFSPGSIEPFSSQGPTFSGLTKPDVVATDGVSVSGAGGFPSPFFGTSATAPHVAGLAALLLQLNPGLTRSQLKSVIKRSAVPLGDVNVFGLGRIDGLSAANLAVAPGRASNISTRGVVQTGDDVMIGGFIIGGTTPKTVLIRARGA